MKLTNDREKLLGRTGKSRVFDDFTVRPDLVLMEIPQWVADDLGLESYLAWTEGDHEVLRYWLTASLLGRECGTNARVGPREVPALDGSTMTMLGIERDESSGELKVLPAPYLRI